MLKRMIIGSLFLLLIASSSFAGESETQKEVKIVKEVRICKEAGDTKEVTVEMTGEAHPCVTVNGVAVEALCMVGEDKIEAAGKKMSEVIAELNSSGDLSDAGMEKLLRLLEEIGTDLKSGSQASPGLARVIRLDGEAGVEGELHKAYAIALNGVESSLKEAEHAYEIAIQQLADTEGEAGELHEQLQLELRKLHEGEAGSAADAMKAYAVAIGSEDGEMKDITIELESLGEDGPKVYRLKTVGDGEILDISGELNEDVIAELKELHGIDLDVLMLDDLKGEVIDLSEFHSGAEGKPLRWVEGGHDIGIWHEAAGKHHEHLQQWFEEWEAITEELAVKLDAADIELIHDQLAELRELLHSELAGSMVMVKGIHGEK